MTSYNILHVLNINISQLVNRDIPAPRDIGKYLQAVDVISLSVTHGSVIFTLSHMTFLTHRQRQLCENSVSRSII